MLINSKLWVILRISVLFLSSYYTQCFWRVSYNYFDLESQESHPNSLRLLILEVGMIGFLILAWLLTTCINLIKLHTSITSQFYDLTNEDSGIFLTISCIWHMLLFSRSVVSDSLWPHGPQHARPPCPSPSPGVWPKFMFIASVMPSSRLIL